MLLADHQITKRAKEGMISPFQEKSVSESPYSIPENYIGNSHKVISFGLSSYGYDARIDTSFLKPRFDLDANPIVDPKHSAVSDYEHVVADSIIIPPHSFVLGKTVEYFRIPRDILALCVGKSTYARCGINCNITPLEPGWEGFVTLEISNTNVKPVKIYSNEGICQFLFAWCDPNQAFGNTCLISYADKGGKYQGQQEVTIAR